MKTKHQKFSKAFFAIVVLAAAITNQAWCLSYNVIFLNPDGFDSCVATATNGTQQVGYGSGSATGGNAHALLWNGSATSYVDLNPSGYWESECLGICGTQQVGNGAGPEPDHAMLWNGSAGSYVDLSPPTPVSLVPLALMAHSRSVGLVWVPLATPCSGTAVQIVWSI